MKVREAFERAFGPPTKDAYTCHVGHDEGDNSYFLPTIQHIGFKAILYWDEVEWMVEHNANNVVGPDISDRPAGAFLGFFGDEFDSIVNGGKS